MSMFLREPSAVYSIIASLQQKPKPFTLQPTPSPLALHSTSPIPPPIPSPKVNNITQYKQMKTLNINRFDNISIGNY